MTAMSQRHGANMPGGGTSRAGNATIKGGQNF